MIPHSAYLAPLYYLSFVLMGTGVSLSLVSALTNIFIK